MPDITKVVDMLGMLESKYLDVHPERCVMVRNKNASCFRCAAVCTSHAITAQGGKLEVDPDLCIGCGTCSVVCPTSAIEPLAPAFGELLEAAVSAMRENEGVAVFTCPVVAKKAKKVDAAKIIELTCLGRIDESLLVGLVLAGAEKIVLVDGPCKECQHVSGRELVGTTVTTANSLLEVFGQSPAVTFSADLPENVYARSRFASRSGAKLGVSRRDFFGQLKTEAQTYVYEGTVDAIGLGSEKPAEETLTSKLRVGKSGVMTQRAPAHRERLLSYLDAMGAPEEDSVVSSLWGYVSIDKEACQKCRLCTVFCPTGALFKYDQEGSWGVGFSAVECVACGLCKTVCLKGALSLSSKVSLVELLACEIEYIEMGTEPINEKRLFGKTILG